MVVADVALFVSSGAFRELAVAVGAWACRELQHRPYRIGTPVTTGTLLVYVKQLDLHLRQPATVMLDGATWGGALRPSGCGCVIVV